jgi:hypothetical protein
MYHRAAVNAGGGKRSAWLSEADVDFFTGV